MLSDTARATPFNAQRIMSMIAFRRSGPASRLGYRHGGEPLEPVEGARSELAPAPQTQSRAAQAAPCSRSPRNSSIAEFIIVHLHGYVLRGDQPRELRRVLVGRSSRIACARLEVAPSARCRTAVGVIAFAAAQSAL
jgi:hypothetical protein